MAYESPCADVVVPLVSLPEFILQTARRQPFRPAIIDGLTGRTITYGELESCVRRTAGGLVAHGLSKGDVVATYSPNVPEYTVAFFGVGLAGGTVATVNALYNAVELTHQLRDAGATWLITSPQAVDTACRAAAAAGVTHVYAFGEVPGATAFDSLACTSTPADVPVDARQDIAALPYSNATTGLPKGVMLTHYNLVASVLQAERLDSVGAEDIVIAMMPFHHVYGMSAVMSRCLRAGATLVTLPKFDVQQFLETVEKYKVTIAYAVPPIIRTLAKHPLVSSYDLSSLRHVVSAAAPLPEALARAATERVGFALTQQYGMTETSLATHMTPWATDNVTSVGVVVPNTECRIVDVATKRDLAPGEPGEIFVRGPQVMMGYRNSPDVTRRMIDRDGWFHTGDIGFTDRDGYFYVVERAKDLVKFRGLQYRDDELLLASVEDLVARRQAAERLRHQALLLDSVRESVVGTDGERRVTFWNKGAEALFGYTAEEAMGASVDQLLVPEDVDVRRQRVEEDAHLARHGEWQVQALRKRKDGSLFWADIVVSAVQDGATAGFIALHRDITELKNSQAMLRDSNERLQNLTSRLMDVREHERAALARELHDELGQALTRLKIDLCALTEALPARLRTQRVAGMVPLVDRMLSTVQHLSAELRPAVLDDLGLEAAIESQANEFAEWNGTPCELDLHIGEMPTDRDRDIAIFRILQEALTNVARHAHARAIRITSRADANQFVLEVADNGVGIPPGQADSPRSLGLIGMRERARAVAGDIEIAPVDGHGTLVRLRVPTSRAAKGGSHDSAHCC